MAKKNYSIFGLIVEENHFTRQGVMKEERRKMTVA